MLLRYKVYHKCKLPSRIEYIHTDASTSPKLRNMRLQKLCTKIKKVNRYLGLLLAMLTAKEMGKPRVDSFCWWGSVSKAGAGYGIMKLYSTNIFVRVCETDECWFMCEICLCFMCGIVKYGNQKTKTK